MTTLYATFTARAGYEDEVAQMIADLAQKVRTEPGNVVFDVYRRADNPASFFVFEVYKDQAAFEAHLAMPYGKAFNDRLEQIIIEPHSQLTFLHHDV